MLFNKVVHGANLTFRANLKWLLEELQFLALMHFYSSLLTINLHLANGLLYELNNIKGWKQGGNFQDSLMGTCEDH